MTGLLRVTEALDLAAFLIAAPQGLWCYRRDGLRVTMIQHVTSLAIHAAPDQLRDLLLRQGS